MPFYGGTRAALRHAPAAGVASSILFKAIANRSDNLTSYTEAMSTGTGSRYVIVAINAQKVGGGTPSDPTVTVDGNACTKVVEADNAVAEACFLYITNAAFSGSDSVNVVANFGAETMHNIQLATLQAVLTSNTATATASDITDPTSQSLAVSAGGVAVAVAGTAVSGSSFTWSGLTERGDTSGDSITGSVASDDFAAASTPTVAATPASSTRPIMCAAAFL